MTAESAAQIGEMLVDDCNCNASSLKVSHLRRLFMGQSSVG